MEPQISSSGFKEMESGSGIITSISSSSWSVHQEEEAAAVGLSLELGRGYSGQKLDRKRSFLGFTILQLQELQLQALIFKYIEAGLPVPYHLVLPIWQSFSCSFGNFPTSLGISQMCVDSRKGIEEEPWRCRRTDGKKWRCGKEALAHQKYCERHVHRGRHRSRKLVDSSHYGTTTTSSPNNNGVNIGGGGGGGGSRTSDICINGDANAGSNLTDLSISLPVNTISSALFPRFGFSS